jgi:hypothetical protein
MIIIFWEVAVGDTVGVAVGVAVGDAGTGADLDAEPISHTEN